MLYLNSASDAPKNQGQIKTNLNDYHFDPMEISGTFWLPDKTDWPRQQEERHTKYPDLPNMARDEFSIIPHHVIVESRFSLGQDVICWRQSKTTGETHCEKVSARQFASANNWFLRGNHPALGTTNSGNNSEMKKDSEHRK